MSMDSGLFQSSVLIVSNSLAQSPGPRYYLWYDQFIGCIIVIIIIIIICAYSPKY